MSSPVPSARAAFRPRTLFRRWGARGLYVVYLLVACEALLHVLALASPTLKLRLSNRYGAAPYLDDACLGRRPNPRYGDHDARGFRNAGVPSRADVVALGDSQTYGISARRENAWPQQLARQRGLVVYNMACGGWGPPHYLVLLPQALELHPRLVLLTLYTGNDLWDALEMVYVRRCVPELTRLAVANPGFAERVRAAQRELERVSLDASRWLSPDSPGADAPVGVRGARARAMGLVREHSRLWGAWRALRSALPARPLDEDPPSAEQAEVLWRRLRAGAAGSSQVAACEAHGVRTLLDVGYRLRAFDPELWPEGLRLALAALEIAHERLNAAGVRSLVVLIPTKELVFHGLCPADVRARGAYEQLQEREARARQQAQARLSARGIAWIDTAPALEAALRAGVAAYPQTSDSHPNAAGYAALARAVASSLGGDGLQP